MLVRKFLLGIIAALALAGSAKADIIYTLNTSNDSKSGAGPYAQVDIHLIDSTHATATFTRLGTFVFGEMGLDINAATFGITGLSFMKNAGDTKTPTYTVSYGGKVGSIGNFALDYVDKPNGFSDAVTSASFEITDKSGTWANESSVLTNTVPEAAVHAFTGTGYSFFASGGPTNCTDCTPPPCTDCQPPPCTTNCGPPPCTTNCTTQHSSVPEPATIALLGVGLFGLGIIRRRAN
jgi:hypothetical protein